VPDGQTLPHTPQFLESVVVSVHPPVAPQQVNEPQTALQRAQLFGSVFVFVHTPLHNVVGAGHPHVPPRQTWPEGQALPHAPQFCASVDRSLQAFPHTE
jgi:hypothetical protein